MIALKSVILDSKWNSVEATWVDSDGVQIKCHSYADVQMEMFRTDAAALGTSLAAYETLIAAVEAAIVPCVSPPAPVPTSLTMKQARLALLGAGLYDAVAPAIAAIADPIERRAAEISWEFANTVERTDPLVAMLAAGFGLDSAALDALFTTGAAL